MNGKKLKVQIQQGGRFLRSVYCGVAKFFYAFRKELHNAIVLLLPLILVTTASNVAAQQSEVDSLLSSSHETSWGYFQDPGRNNWFISSQDGTTHNLSVNDRNVLSWIPLGSDQKIANINFATKQVSIPNSAFAGSAFFYDALSLVDGGKSSMYGGYARQVAGLIIGQTMKLSWYFFQVKTTGIWYIVLVDGTDSTILRLNLNSSLSDYDWKKPVDSSGIEVDTKNWSKQFVQENGKWVVKLARSSAPNQNTSRFLGFPLPVALFPQGAFTPNKTTSILDHQMSSVYGTDGVVLSYTGELFRETSVYRRDISAPCYPKVGNAAWLSDLLKIYRGTAGTGANDCSNGVAVNYDGHPGYDYLVASGTEVTSPAAGRVVNTSGGCIQKGFSGCDTWGAVAIDHGNGYVTQYLHLSSVLVRPGDVVSGNQRIALSGAKNTGGAHLHFEVLQLRVGFPNDYAASSYATVDPYGFDLSGGYADPIADSNSSRPNICLWKVGCK